jgi:hypothetical protein
VHAGCYYCQVVWIIKDCEAISREEVSQSINVSVKEEGRKDTSLKYTSLNRDSIGSGMCRRDTHVLVEELNSVFDVCREASFAQLISKQKRVVTTVKGAFKIEKDNAWSTTRGAIKPPLISGTGFNNKLEDVDLARCTRLETGL